MKTVRTQIKRILSVLLALLILAVSVPVAFGATVVDSGTCGKNGDNVTWSLDSNGVLTISGTGAMADYTLNSKAPWYSSVTSAVIETGVTSIGDYAFYYCRSLTSVTIPDSVTSIGDLAFYYCSDLTSVTIGNSVTSIGSSAFAYCESLTNVTIPDSVTSIGGSAFYGCSGLTSVTIGNSVTSIGERAFEDCRSLTSVTIGNSVTSIGSYAFYGCTSLESVTIGNSVTSIGDSAFRYCTALESVTIPNSVTSIGWTAFQECTALQSVTIPDSVTSIGGSAFYGCTALQSVTIPNSVTSIGVAAFYHCTALESITVDADNPSYASDESGCLFNKDKTTLIQYPIGNARTSYTIPDSVTTIGSSAFQNCTSLESVTIPDSVTSIGGSAFYGCTALQSVTIPNSVTNFGDGAFFGCTALKSVTIPNSVTSISMCAFENCTALRDVYYGGTKAQWNEITIAFGNKPLTNATIHYHTHTLTVTAAAAATCTKAGNSAYWTCSGCGKFFADANGATEITENSWVRSVDPTNHTPGEMQLLESTFTNCETGGSATYAVYCAECGKEISRQTVELPAGQHYVTAWTIHDRLSANPYREGVCELCKQTVREALDPFVAAGELESADGSVKIVYAADALPENTVVTAEEQHDPLGDGKPAYCLTVELENDGDWVRPTAGTAIIMIKLPEAFNVADRAQLDELYGALMVRREAWVENGYICSEMAAIGAEAFSTYIVTLKEETQPQEPPAEEPVTNPPATTDPAPQNNDAPQNFFQRVTSAFTNFFASIRSFFAKLFGL